MKTAFIFPGQGAQFVGMGREFYDASPDAAAIFEKADEVLGKGLRDVVFNGPPEQLTSTAFCQPAILTMSLAALKAFEGHPKYRALHPAFAAGLSLGEYSALCAAGAMSFEDTLRLVERRSACMEEAVRRAKGAMAAIIGLDRKTIVDVCAAAGAEVANFNSPQQIVITGHADKVEEAGRRLKEAGARNVVPLDVSGAFHSTLMRPAAEKFGGELSGVRIEPPLFPVVSNVDARPAEDPEAIRSNLARQITSPVRWVDQVEYMAAQGVSTFIEIGPGKVLKGLIRRTNADLKVFNIEKPDDIDQLPA